MSGPVKCGQQSAFYRCKTTRIQQHAHRERRIRLRHLSRRHAKALFASSTPPPPSRLRRSVTCLINECEINEFSGCDG